MTFRRSAPIRKTKSSIGGDCINLHFSPTGDRAVLFVWITESDVFVINVLPHGRGDSETWVDTELLRILHENWPDAARKAVGIRGESLTATQRVNLHDSNANFATSMRDGTVYLSPGGGVVASGRCIWDVRDSDVIFARLARWEWVVKENETSIRSALNVPCAEELRIRMKFDNDEWRLYEANGNREIRLISKGQESAEAHLQTDLASRRLDSAIQQRL